MDLIAILTNISHSLSPLQKVISGGAYVLGIVFFFSAIMSFYQIGNHRTGSPSKEKMFAPIMHVLIGSILIYLPTGLHIAANTVFGVGNILTYGSYSSTNIQSIIELFIHTAGIIWFVRGCVLLVHSSEPGTGQGFKGLAFLISGILATNFDNTVSMLNYFLANIWSITFKLI